MRLARRSLLVVLLTAVAVSAQPTTRRAANIAALLANPAFYHLRPVVIVGEVKLADSGELRVSSEAGALPLIVASGSALFQPHADGPVEGAGVEVGIAELPGQPEADHALAGTGRAVDRNRASRRHVADCNIGSAPSVRG
jgi:hypothetical protein